MNSAQLKTKYNITAWNTLGLNYWGIPKCMNTSIKYSLYKKLNPDDTQSVEGIPIWVHEPHLLTYVSKSAAIKNGHTNFTVVRHPYDRVVSLYKDIMFRRPKAQLLRGVDNTRLNGLDDFIDTYIVPINDNGNIHLRSISYFICRNGKPLFPEVHTFDTISEFLGMELSHINTTEKMDVTLTPDHKRLIRERYAKDFKIFKFYE